MAYNSTTLYQLYALHVGDSPIQMKGVRAANLNPGIDAFFPNSPGVTLPRFRAVNKQNAMLEIETHGIGQLISNLSMGMAPYVFDDSPSGENVVAYWAAQTANGLIFDGGQVRDHDNRRVAFGQH